MKIKIIPSIVSVLIAALSGYAIFSFASSEENLLLGISSAILFSITLFGVFGFSLEKERKATNIHVLAGTFNVIFLAISIVFACLHTFSVPAYVIINGILLLICVLIAYAIVTKSTS